MSRYILAIGSLAILGLACSLGASDASEQTSPDEGPSRGGVPISKSTAVPVEEASEAPAQEPQSTSPPQTTSQPQSTQAPVQPPPQDLPDPEDVPIAIIDLNVAGSEEYPRLIGLIQNISSVPLKSVYVTARFLDADGNTVKETLGSIMGSVVLPGGISPFEMNFPGEVPPSVESVETTIEWAVAGADYPWTTEGLEITDTSTGMSYTNFQISGTLRNTTGKMAEFITLIPIGYNADGKFIGYSLKVIEELAAGESIPFTVSIPDSSRAEPTVDHFEILTVIRYED